MPMEFVVLFLCCRCLQESVRGKAGHVEAEKLNIKAETGVTGPQSKEHLGYLQEGKNDILGSMTLPKL